jgi:hypothetical protein
MLVNNGRQDKCILVIFSSIFWAPPRSDGLSCSIQQRPQGAGSGYPFHGGLLAELLAFSGYCSAKANSSIPDMPPLHYYPWRAEDQLAGQLKQVGFPGPTKISLFCRRQHHHLPQPAGKHCHITTSAHYLC